MVCSSVLNASLYALSLFIEVEGHDEDCLRFVTAIYINAEISIFPDGGVTIQH